MASFYSAIYGNPKAFTPRWFGMPNPMDYFLPHNWNYLYDITPLKNTLRKYIDFNYLKRNAKRKDNNDHAKQSSRLIITSTDIQKGKAVIFDSYHTD